ncbi:helix-turn-helix domain-containing protein [Streptomyces sp. NRRL WC-3742]|uniref:helix-turn-helix domain-containing protein n=1 Tax=Streptomyces sp. NRRL WC-3742 TaxID=1463934 RepID=UPI00068C4E19|nr:helix-turn-helix transcriptional regulator [Streptomyces sp. NRRL WC-3742]
MESNEYDETSSLAIRFGRELRRLRKARGWSQVELGKRMGYSHGLVSYIEGAKKPITLKFAVKADEVFETGGTFVELWRIYSRASLLEGFPEYALHEARAIEVRHFEPAVVPGLLQTPDYARAFASAAVRRGSITEKQLDDRLDFLVTRQRLIDRHPAPHLHFVLDEGALRRRVGGPEVMARQLKHLEELAVRPNVTIQVAPFSLAEELPFTMVVTLLTMPDRTLLAYSECQLRGFLAREKALARAWERDYHQLQVEAPSKGASLEMIRSS